MAIILRPHLIVAMAVVASGALIIGCAGGDSDSGVNAVGLSRAAAMAPGATPATGPLPTPGSGKTSVDRYDDWAATLPQVVAGCQDDGSTPSLYPWPIITSDGQFDLRFFKTERNGSKVTYYYDVKRLPCKDHDDKDKCKDHWDKDKCKQHWDKDKCKRHKDKGDCDKHSRDKCKDHGWDKCKDHDKDECKKHENKDKCKEHSDKDKCKQHKDKSECKEHDKDKCKEHDKDKCDKHDKDKDKGRSYASWGKDDDDKGHWDKGMKYCEKCPQLGHFNVSLRRLLECLRPGCTLQQLVVKIGAKTDPNRDGDPGDAMETSVSGSVGLDPMTGITGVKWSNPPKLNEGEIMWLYVTIDEKCIKDGFKLSENMNRCAPGIQGAVATQAGYQDIRRKGGSAPGYAFLPTPFCVRK